MRCNKTFFFLPIWRIDLCNHRPSIYLSVYFPTDQFWSQWLLMLYTYWHTSPTDAHDIIWACGIYIWHLRSILVPGIYFVVVWLTYVDYNRSAVDKSMQCAMHICSGAYVSNVETMHASGHGHILTEFKWGRCIDKCLVSAHDVNGTCGICAAFEGHICC